MDGYFWEDLFFFLTDQSIYLLVPNVIAGDVVILELAKLAY